MRTTIGGKSNLFFRIALVHSCNRWEILVFQLGEGHPKMDILKKRHKISMGKKAPPLMTVRMLSINQ